MTFAHPHCLWWDSPGIGSHKQECFFSWKQNLLWLSSCVWFPLAGLLSLCRLSQFSEYFVPFDFEIIFCPWRSPFKYIIGCFLLGEIIQWRALSALTILVADTTSGGSGFKCCLHTLQIYWSCSTEMSCFSDTSNVERQTVTDPSTF